MTDIIPIKPKTRIIDDRSRTGNVLSNPDYTETATSGIKWGDSNYKWSSSAPWGGPNTSNIGKPNISIKK